MSTVTGWFPLVLTTFFGGVIGSLITTYGSQTGERRNARSQVRAALYQTRTMADHWDNEDQLSHGLDEFEITAMLGGLPKRWVQLYKCVSVELWRLLREDSHDSKEFLKIIRFLTQEVTQALTDATWHPWRSRLRWWYPLRRYDSVFRAVHLSLLKGVAGALGLTSTEQLAEHFEYALLDRKSQRELIRFSRNKNPEHFVSKPLPVVIPNPKEDE